MFSSPSSSLQKTYDECYLTCSTAVYFESQNNEAEALRSWKRALDQINTYRYVNRSSLARNRSETETDRALRESLGQLEGQCRERVELLEALRVSREEAEREREGREKDGSGQVPLESLGSGPGRSPPPPGYPSRRSPPPSGYPPRRSPPPSGYPPTRPPPPPPPRRTSVTDSSNWLGGGTVPPVSYSDLSRPPLPARPSLEQHRRASGDARSGSTTSLARPSLEQYRRASGDGRKNSAISLASTRPSLSPAPQPRYESSRTPSPEKKTRMLRTLRPANNGREARRPSSSKMSSASSARAPVAAKAATLAFGTKAHAKPNRNVYLRNPGSSESLPVPSTAPSNRSSFDCPRPALEPQTKFLACSAASCSRSDLGTEKDPHLNRHSASSLQQLTSTSTSNTDHRIRRKQPSMPPLETLALEDPVSSGLSAPRPLPHRKARGKQQRPTARAEIPSITASDIDDSPESSSPTEGVGGKGEKDKWQARVNHVLKHLPRGVDESAARQILDEIVIHGDEVRWADIAGLDVAKSALKETVVYPFLRPDLFSGLREPARGLLLFGPPGTGKTMLARAVATESKSTFFAISASSLTSKFLGESEKLVRALFAMAKVMSPSVIFVDEIDSLLSERGGAEHEATRRIKTEFLIQWSDLAKAAAGREREGSSSDKEGAGGKDGKSGDGSGGAKQGGKGSGDASMVLVLAATNLPWAIDDAARRRFVRRQYIPLPEGHVRMQQLRTLLKSQKHEIGEVEMERLVRLTEGFSGSDITALAKDAAMQPLRSLGEKLLSMRMDEIRPIRIEDFEKSLESIRPSVSKAGLRRYEEWAREFGERGG